MYYTEFIKTIGEREGNVEGTPTADENMNRRESVLASNTTQHNPLS